MSQFSFFLIKALVLGIFILINVFLLYQELKLYEHQNIDLGSKLANSTEQILTERSGRNRLNQYVFVYVPALATYFGLFQSIKNERSTNEALQTSRKAKIELDKVKQQVYQEQSINETNKVKILSSAEHLSTKTTEYTEAINKSTNAQENLDKIQQLKLKQVKGEKLSDDEKNLISNENLFKTQKIYDANEAEKAIISIEETKKELENQLNNSSLFILDYNDILAHLSQEELLALCNLVFNQLILSNIIGITLILYGDYLIKRFNLEIKYPKLAKLIQLRRKFKEYHLKISIVFIILCVLPQIAMNIYILLPQIQSIFTG